MKLQDKNIEQEFTFKNFFVPLTAGKAIFWIVAVGFITYFNSLFNGFVGDDFLQVVNNDAVRSLGNILSLFFHSTFFEVNSGTPVLTGNYYKPFLSIAFSLIYMLSGGTAFIFHLVQLILHISNSVLIFLIFQRLFKKSTSFAAALFFLLHPINNESVVFISGLQEPLFLLFGLIALRIRQRDNLSITKNIIIAILLLSSILSKETGALFLIIIPLYTFLIKNKWKTEIVWNILTFFVYIFLRVFLARIYINNDPTALPFWNTTLLQKLVNMPLVVFYYLQQFLFPKDLIMSQRWFVSEINFNSFYFPLVFDLIFLLIVIVIGVIFFLKKDVQTKLYLFFAIWFFLGIGLHLQIIPLDFTVSERWFYFPIIGLLGILAIIINKLNFTNKTIRQYCIVIFIIVALIFSMRNIVRNANWKNSLTIYEHDIKYVESDYVMHMAYATELSNKGNNQKALYHINHSIRLHLGYTNLTILGLIYARENKLAEAEKVLNNALKLNDKNYLAYITLAKIKMSQVEDSKSTIAFLKELIKKFPNSPDIWAYLIVWEYKYGSEEEALFIVNKAMNIFPPKEMSAIRDSIINNQPISITYEY